MGNGWRTIVMVKVYLAQGAMGLETPHLQNPTICLPKLMEIANVADNSLLSK